MGMNHGVRIRSMQEMARMIMNKQGTVGGSGKIQGIVRRIRSVHGIVRRVMIMSKREC
jgi:hypothetical protein